jgi:integrase
MVKHNGLPPRVFEHGRWYCLVTAQGKKRIWTKISRIADGLPVMYSRLAQMLADDVADPTLLPKIISVWESEVMVRHADKTQTDEMARNRTIAKRFAQFRADDVTPPVVGEFLREWREKEQARTHNLYRAQVRELMRFAIEKGWRREQVNPVDAIRTMSENARTRYITDDEFSRIKAAALVGLDGRKTESGEMLGCLLDIAYMTGQRVTDWLDLRWAPDPDDANAPHISEQGLWFRPSKTRKKTAAAVLVEWTPALEATVKRLKELKLARPGSSPWVFIQRTGKRYTYWGVRSAFDRACERAQVKDANLRDFRAKALTDVDDDAGLAEAQKMGAHSTQTQTADYVRHKKARRVRATR